MRAMHDAQLWNDILHASGGALEHSKCNYYWRSTIFDKHRAPVFVTGEFGPPICIKDDKGNETQLKQLSAYQPYKTLGTYQCVGNRQQIQLQTLIDKSKGLARVLATS